MTDERIAILQNRIDMYALLSRIFRREADEALLAALAAAPLPESTGIEAMDDGWRLLSTSLASPDPMDKKLEDLAVDYARVFLGAGQVEAKAAYPFESVYTSPGRLVMQDAWEQVCKVYADAGLSRRDKDDLHEDHAALELDFLARMGERALQAAQAGDEAAAEKALSASAEFLAAHPMRWIERFAADIRRYGETDFYRGASLLLEAFVKADLDFLRNQD